MRLTASTILRSISVAALVLSTSLSSAEPINLKGSDGFQLKGDYFQGKEGRPAILMLHQCNAERSMYYELGEALSKKGIHALSLDFRLYGESVTEEVSLTVLQKKAASREEARELTAPHRAMWLEDVVSAYDFIRKAAGDDASIGVIGASCGGHQAISLAEVESVASMVFFSSGINERATERYLALESIPTLIIAAQDDQWTYERAQVVFESAQHPDNRFIAYKSGGHGYPLFEHDPDLVSAIVEWFDQQL